MSTPSRLSLALLIVACGGAGMGPTDPADAASAQRAAAAECERRDAAWIWCDDFDIDRIGAYFEHGRPDAFSRAAGVGLDGSTGMKARFLSGQVEAGSLKVAFGRTPSSYFRPVDAGRARYTDVYWRVYVRNQPGWTGGGGAKLSRAIAFAASNWSEAAIGHVWSGGEGNRYLVLDPASGTDAAGNLKTTKYNDFANLRWLGARTGATPLFDAAHVGAWHCVEAHMRLNDPGASNGVFELWVDGNPEASVRTLNWLGRYEAYGINAVFLENYWNEGSPQEQVRFFDNLVVSTARIGCLTRIPHPSRHPVHGAQERVEQRGIR